MTIMSELTTTVAVPNAGWVKLNAGQHVPCRVAYDAEGLAALSEAVKSMAIGPEVRVGR